jgi:hypothetical protein
MAGVTGLEPATSGVTGRRSNQLSYTPAALCARRRLVTRYIRGVKRRGPQDLRSFTTLSRDIQGVQGGVALVGDEGFEPPTPSV